VATAAKAQNVRQDMQATRRTLSFEHGLNVLSL